MLEKLFDGNSGMHVSWLNFQKADVPPNRTANMYWSPIILLKNYLSPRVDF